MAKGDAKKWKENVDKKLGSIGKKLKSIDDKFGSIDKKFNVLDNDILAIKSDMLYVKVDMREMKTTMYTKQDHHDLMVILDEFRGEVVESRNERIILGYRYTDINDRLFDYEKRIKVLEKKGGAKV